MKSVTPPTDFELSSIIIGRGYCRCCVRLARECGLHLQLPDADSQIDACESCAILLRRRARGEFWWYTYMRHS